MALPGEEFSCTGLAITVNPEPARDDFGNTLVDGSGKPVFRLGFRVCIRVKIVCLSLSHILKRIQHKLCEETLQIVWFEEP